MGKGKGEERGNERMRGVKDERGRVTFKAAKKEPREKY
jgi:hypothetical protein